MSADRTWVVAELKRCLRALCLDGEQALACAPSGAHKADELALDYDNFVSAALASPKMDFTPEQVAALRRVDDLLSAMSGNDHEELWTNEAVRSHPRWEEIRSQARAAVRVLGWEE